MKKVLILGGGVSGLSVAWKLVDLGVDVEIIESKNQVGGLAATVKKNEYYLDYGPHFFLSEKKNILKKVKDIFKIRYNKDMLIFRRDAKLFFNGNFLNYPLTINNILFQIPFSDSLFSVSSYFYSQIKKCISNLYKRQNINKDFETWVKYTFGLYLYKIFFKPYTEQFWGIPCEKLSPHCLPTNTKLSFFKTLKLIFQRRATKENPSLVERETTFPLNYPPNGIGMIADSIAQDIKQKGGKINLGLNIKKIDRDKMGSFIITASKKGKTQNFKGNFIISTIPLPKMINMLKPIPNYRIISSSKKLEYLSLIIIYLVTNKNNILNGSYLYFLNRPYNRISETNKFSVDLNPTNENMLAIEISCYKDDDVWQFSKEKLFELCIKSLEKDKLLRKEDVKKIFVLKNRYAYPIYFHDYEPNLKNLLDYVDSIPNLEVVGRTGKYMYQDIDKCIIEAFDLVDKILPKLNKNDNL